MNNFFVKYLMILIIGLSANKNCAQTNYQNLIPNGSFEKMKSFSIDSFSILSQQDTSWKEFGTYYFFSKLFLPTNNAPKNFIGFQEPQKGYNYYSQTSIANTIKCSLPSGWESQSYAQVKLHKKLRKKKMRGILYVSLIDTAEFATSRIGLYFSNNRPTPQFFCPFNNCPFISATPQIQRPFGQAITNKVNWTKIEGTFQGNGETWMSMGNFYRANQTDTIRVSNFLDTIPAFCFSEGAMYYIDNLSLVEEDRAVAYFDTTKKYLCVQQGTPKILGDTANRPWLFYLWRNANGDSVGNMRNYTYNAAVLENTFFTVEIKDTGEYAFITKVIDTIYVSSSISGLGCTYVGVEDIRKDAETIDFYFADNTIRFTSLHERFTVASTLRGPQGPSATVVLKSLDGKTIFKTKLERKQNDYAIDRDLEQGFYFVEIIYNGNSIKRKKIVIN